MRCHISSSLATAFKISIVREWGKKKEGECKKWVESKERRKFNVEKEAKEKEIVTNI